MKWHAALAGSASQGCAVWEGETLIAAVPGDIDSVKERARLIAAAPELLAALKIALEIIGHGGDNASRLIAEVIAKAEGAQTASQRSEK